MEHRCVPRAKNEALARLMDAGNLLFGRIDAVNRLNDWLRINVRIFMRRLVRAALRSRQQRPGHGQICLRAAG